MHSNILLTLSKKLRRKAQPFPLPHKQQFPIEVNINNDTAPRIPNTICVSARYLVPGDCVHQYSLDKQRILFYDIPFKLLSKTLELMDPTAGAKWPHAYHLQLYGQLKPGHQNRIWDDWVLPEDSILIQNWMLDDSTQEGELSKAETVLRLLAQ